MNSTEIYVSESVNKDIEPSNVCHAPQLPESTVLMPILYHLTPQILSGCQNCHRADSDGSNGDPWAQGKQKQPTHSPKAGRVYQVRDQRAALHQNRMVQSVRRGWTLTTSCHCLLRSPWQPYTQHTCQGSRHGRTGKSRWRMNTSERPVSRTISNVLTSCEVDGSLAKLPSHFLRVQPYV